MPYVNRFQNLDKYIEQLDIVIKDKDGFIDESLLYFYPMNSNTKDLSGMQIYDWKVLGYKGHSYWYCKCSCGRIKGVDGRTLITNNPKKQSKSCGHKTKEDIVGKQIKNWQVIEKLPDYKYKCKCIQCGREHIFNKYFIEHNQISECRHTEEDIKLIDITNQDFGILHVNFYTGKDKKWDCTCKVCGSHILKSHKEIVNGKYEKCTHKYTQNQEHDNKFIDLTNKRFGDYTAIEYLGKGKWKCECICGIIDIVTSINLRKKGQNRKCTHHKYETSINKQFNELKVIEKVDNTHLKCKCSCGKIGIYDAWAVVSGHVKSCGAGVHRGFVDIKGKKFGELTPLKYIGEGKWECQCSCGKHTVAYSLALRNGQKISCGCSGRLYRLRKLTDRTDEQILATESRENMIKFINGSKPTMHELERKLNITYGSVIKLIKQFDLKEYITLDQHASRYEDELYEYIRTIYVGDIDRHNRSVLKGQELDIYIPDKRIAIEFNGTYWHSYPYKDELYHQNKTIDCIKENIHLIHIFEYEWVNDIQKQKILNYIHDLICSTTIIYARETILKELDYSDILDFESENHLQGSASSKINLGLFFNNELIQIMTFGAPRFNNNFQYEMIRLCSKSSYSIVGGAEKLFSYFVKAFKPASIISYCDMAKFNGAVYFRLGFTTDKKSLTKPGYVWVSEDRKDVLSRYQTQKQKLINLGLGIESQTENEIMENLNYLKIYDCGNMRFIWEK